MTGRINPKFDAWFKEQYGQLPSERRRERALVRKRAAEIALRDAEIDYKIEDARFVWFDSALKGWNARNRK